MQAIAKLQHAKISAQKVHLVANQIRGLRANLALELLSFSNKKAAPLVRGVLYSAISNAEHNEGADVDDLKVFRIYIDEGPTQKRTKPRAKGRADRILKRSCHITVIVSD